MLIWDNLAVTLVSLFYSAQFALDPKFNKNHSGSDIT